MYNSGRFLPFLKKIDKNAIRSYSSLACKFNGDIVCQGRNRTKLCKSYSILTYHNKNTPSVQHINVTLNRLYSSRNNKSGSKRHDPKRALTVATYISFGIGGSLLLAMLYKWLCKAVRRLQGIEDVKDPVFGLRPIMIRYKDVILPKFTSKILKDVESFEVREDDVWVVSYPRSGTTWLQEIVYLIQTNLDFQTAKKVSLENRFPYLEYEYPGLKAINEMKSPRLIKTHFPMTLLPEEIKQKNPKIIYIVRNPKDVLVSYYHFTKMLKPTTRYKGTFEEFYHRFINNKICYSPWWKHVKDFWDNKNQQNILFISYEDLQKDINSSIRKIADFLGKPLSEADVCKIAEHCQFKNMKNNEMLNFSWWKESGIADIEDENDFLRKGITGDWKKQLTEEMNKRIDRMVIMKFYGSGLEFQYQIGDGDSGSTGPVNSPSK